MTRAPFSHMTIWKVLGFYGASRVADAELVFTTRRLWLSEEGAMAERVLKAKLKEGFRRA